RVKWAAPAVPRVAPLEQSGQLPVGALARWRARRRHQRRRFWRSLCAPSFARFALTAWVSRRALRLTRAPPESRPRTDIRRRATRRTPATEPAAGNSIRAARTRRSTDARACLRLT